MILETLLERKPSFGIVASISGFGASIMAYLQQISIILGFVGAVFGCAAGYYTFRVKKHQWERERQKDREHQQDRERQRDQEHQQDRQHWMDREHQQDRERQQDRNRPQ